MRIAVWHNLISGGGKRALNYHIKALKEKGHYVEIWCPDTALTDQLHSIDKSVKHHVLPLQQQLNRLKYPSRFFKEYRFIKRRNKIIKEHCQLVADQIHEKKFDLVFVNSCSINYMSFLGRYLKLPCALYLGEPYRYNYEAVPDLVWSAPGDGLTFNFIKNHIKILSNRLQVFEEITAAKSYSKVLVNSLYSRESVMRSYGVNSEVCYLGVDDSFLNYVFKKKQPYIVGVGVVYYLKGLDRAIKTIAKIPFLHRPKLVWIGNGEFFEYRQQMDKLATELGVKLEIKLNVAEKSMFDIIAGAAAMIYMPRLEPFGFAPLEANALGTAVVGIAEGGIRETIVHGKNGYLVTSENFEEAAQYVMELVTNLEAAKNLGIECKSHIRNNWSFEKLSYNIESSFFKILNEHA